MGQFYSNLPGSGYGPQVGRSQEGYPVYLYTDPQTRLRRYVVILPDGRALYSDAQGRIGPRQSEAQKQTALALLGGLIGLGAGGPVGALIGAIAGAIVGSEISKKKQGA
jgi:hypothetical protein